MLSRLYSPRKNREDGFTLIELLIVVIIIGILAAIALPIFLNQQKAANDGAVQSDVRNTVDSVQTFLVKNSGTAYANTGAYVAAGGAATISNGDTVGVNIGADGSYQVCGYVTNGNGNQFKSASAAFTYTTSGTAAGTFTTAACTTGSDTGGSNGAQAQGGGGNPAPAGGVTNGIYTATLETGDSTNSMWGTQGGAGSISTAQAHTGSASYAQAYTAGAASSNANSFSTYETFTPSPALNQTKTNYKISAWVYLSSGSSANDVVALSVVNGGTNSSTGTSRGAAVGNWVNINLTVPSSAFGKAGTVLQFAVFNTATSNGGTLYLDDLTITPSN